MYNDLKRCKLLASGIDESKSGTKVWETFGMIYLYVYIIASCTFRVVVMNIHIILKCLI